MTGVFSQHVEAIDASEPADSSVIDAIRQVLRSELRRRGILEFGPSLLGYHGNSWDDPEAMGDLSHDCYIRAIATRLRGLRRNLRKSGDIEGLVRRNIRNFVGERQKQLDPVGYAVFQNVKAAVLFLIDAGNLSAVGSDASGISGDSQFEFVTSDVSASADVTELKEILRQNDRLLNDLGKIARIGVVAQELLVEAVDSLSQCGVRRFSVRNVKTCLCELLSEAAIPVDFAREVPISGFQEGFLEDLRTNSADTGYEDSEYVAHMTETLRVEIDGLPRSDAVKDRLRQLLNHLVDSAFDGNDEQKETLDTLAERFGTSRSTLHDDMQCVRGLYRRIATRSRTE